jgi:surface protein
MFKGASAFNFDIGSWNASKITSMDGMFYSAIAFNHNIAKWDTVSVTSMFAMLSSASAFNANIGKWNTATVNARNMCDMLSNARVLNQKLCWPQANTVEPVSIFASAACPGSPKSC